MAETKARGRTVMACTMEILVSEVGKGMMLHPFENYAGCNLADAREMLTDPATVIGVADTGEHVSIICDTSQPTVLLAYWGRDRKAGQLLLKIDGWHERGE